MEPRFGRDFSQVRIHADKQAAESASAVDARAYTVARHVVLGSNHRDLNGEPGRRLLAHELAHVVQQSNSAGTPSIQRDPDPPQPRPRLPLSGDPERASPAGGVAVRNGSLAWTLRFVGEPGSEDVVGGEIHIMRPMDARMDVTFTPTGRTSCPTITFIQIVRATVGGMPAHAHLLFLQDAAGFAVDLAVNRNSQSVETEPFYGAGPQASGPGLGSESGATLAGNAPGRSARASFADGPDFPAGQIPRAATLVREFEVAAICAETSETFGSVRWGYTKTADGTVTLTGGRVSDVQTSAASAQVESARRAYYAGFFQQSLSGFARGSAVLTPAHQTSLRAVAATGNLRRVVLVGANDFSGGPENDPGLSLRRAEAARRFLVDQLHMDLAIIVVEGHGVEAREPNSPGASVAANRRVDIHLERGRLPTGAAEEAGSAREELNLRHRDPHVILDRLIETILELQRLTGPVPAARCRQLSAMVWALNRWRSLDPTVPSLEPFRPAITTLLGRCPSDIPRAAFHWELPPLEPPRSFLPLIEEATHGPPF
jgi:outer membrane protein OmpA-like peptidoglycan-associated protein